jgi:hypothetical protein
LSRANDTVHPYEVVKHYYGGGMEETSVPGITLREYFAAMAMQGLLSKHGDDDYPEETIARKAAKYADALIAWLAK